MVCSKADDWKRCSKARRIAIHHSDFNEMMDNYANRNARSLIFFGDSSKMDFSKYRVLRLLCHMEGKMRLERYRGSPHLRYLQLDTYLRYDKEFGEWIGSLKSLETLDLRGTDLEDISDQIWQIKTLRHVLMYSKFLPPSLEYIRTQGPPTSPYTRNLQTLSAVKYNKSWEMTNGLPNIPEVRELDIRYFPEMGNATLVSLLHKLKHLIFLKIVGDCDGFWKTALSGFPFYDNLKSLVLIKYHFQEMRMTVSTDMLGMLPPHLTELQLRGFNFESDPMLVLEKWTSLKILHIRYGEQDLFTTRIKCSAGGFEQLEELVLEGFPMVNQWEIETGAMPMLQRLRIRYCDPLNVPSELIHLHSLQYLDWYTELQSNADVISNIFKQRPLLRRFWNDYEDLF